MNRGILVFRRFVVCAFAVLILLAWTFSTSASSLYDVFGIPAVEPTATPHTNGLHFSTWSPSAQEDESDSDEDAASDKNDSTCIVPNPEDYFGACTDEDSSTAYDSRNLYALERCPATYFSFEEMNDFVVGAYRARMLALGYVEKDLTTGKVSDVNTWRYIKDDALIYLMYYYTEGVGSVVYLDDFAYSFEEAETASAWIAGYNGGSGRSSGSYSFDAGDSDVYQHQTSVCMACYGTGTCSICNGTGIYRMYGETTVCAACGGTGICSICGGMGQR